MPPCLPLGARLGGFFACASSKDGFVNAPQSFDKGKRERLVVIGNGMAGCRAVEEILERDPLRYEITIFGAEPRVNYNRIMLSPVLAGEKAFADIVINDEAWYRDNHITLHAGRAVTAIDAERKRVAAEGGLEVPYDLLVLANGSEPVRLPLPGAELPGVV